MFNQRFSCRLGFHEWADWYYKFPGSCLQERVCRHCGEVDSLRVISHAWKWDFRSATSRLNKVCLRCSETEGDQLWADGSNDEENNHDKLEAVREHYNWLGSDINNRR
jgi:hypothetical protein